MTGTATPVLYPETASMGYRDKSNYEPFGNQYSGRPLRPYNWVQWTGIAMEAVAALAYGYPIAQRMGLVRDPGFETMTIGMPFLFLGMVLVYSRREEATDPAPELAQARKRWLLITVAICAALIGVAALIEFKGA